MQQHLILPSPIQSTVYSNYRPCTSGLARRKTRITDQRCHTLETGQDEQSTAAPYETSCEFEVRDYELDQFGVVNNAIYLQYLQHGRHKFLQTVNINVDAVARTGNALALSEIKVAFRAPLRASDRVKCTCRCGKSSASRVVFEQSIFKLPESHELSEQKVLEATAVVVSLDSRYKPKRIPKPVIEAMQTGQALENSMEYFRA